MDVCSDVIAGCSHKLPLLFVKIQLLLQHDNAIFDVSPRRRMDVISSRDDSADY